MLTSWLPASRTWEGAGGSCLYATQSTVFCYSSKVTKTPSVPYTLLSTLQPEWPLTSRSSHLWSQLSSYFSAHSTPLPRTRWVSLTLLYFLLFVHCTYHLLACCMNFLGLLCCLAPPAKILSSTKASIFVCLVYSVPLVPKPMPRI